MAVCVGPGFVVNADGSLGLAGPRSAPWPYGTGAGCAIGTINGLKIDGGTGNLWVEPADYQQAVSNTQGTYPLGTPYTVPSAVTAVSPAPAAFTVVNPDACRQLVVSGNAVVTWSFNSMPAGAGVSAYGTLYNGTPPGGYTAPLRGNWTNGTGAASTWACCANLPFSAVVAPGATLTITPVLQISSPNSPQFNGYLFEFEGISFTQRMAL